MRKKGYVGYDIHKNANPEIPESGGLSIVIGFTVTAIPLMIFFTTFLNIILIFLLTVLLAAAIGFIDDRKKLRSRYKIILSIFSGLPIFIANYYNFVKISSPIIPIIDRTRLTIIYPLLIPIMIAISTNTVNMLEGYNGEGSGTCLIAVCFLLICSILWDSAEGVLFTIPVIAVLIPFFLYNKYPAKIFPGDIGTLSIGAMIAGIMLFGSLEVATFCVLLIHIFNSFYVIYSVRGFLESDKIRETKEDIILLKNDQIKASDQVDAALTLPRLILAKGPLSEPDLVNNFLAISIICGLFSIISVLFTQFTIGDLELMIFLVPSLIFMALIGYLIFKFPRIRGIIVLMIALLVGIVFFLIIIESLIMPFSLGTIDLGRIQIPFNLIFVFLLSIVGIIIWYYVTIKYFWYQINKMKKKFKILNKT
ncbi:MAG: hypothetical protein ACFFHD_04955 [Promethearchaeota archaeon]